MNFSSPLFLFIFLPLFLAVWLLAGRWLRGGVLLAGSLLFCIWGEPRYFLLILLFIPYNYWVARRVEALSGEPKKARSALLLGVAVDLGLLTFFKLALAYWAPAIDWIQNGLGVPVSSTLIGYVRKSISLPLGISFFTFSAVSYLLDVYHKRTASEKSLFRFSQYVVLFPKMVAGPIARYRDIKGQLVAGVLNSEMLATGARRFIAGLAKKTLVADPLGRLVDAGVFDRALPGLSTGQAWLVLLFFALQIYYDFSGYSDMAIGLGQMLGFKFVENFNFPYAASSISDFWRRWHISLSGWFRDYVFYPLERRRAAGRGFPQVANILIVFLLTGLWHGMTLNFILWGLLHGLAIALESGRFGRWLKRIPSPLAHFYSMSVVMVGWVLFRSPSPAFAIDYLKTLIGWGKVSMPLPYSVLPPMETLTWVAVITGMLFSFPILKGWKPQDTTAHRQSSLWLKVGQDIGLLVLLVISIIVLAGSSFHPYIYGNF